MAFDQSTITRVYPPTLALGRVRLRWESSAPAGTWFQIYVGRKLTWWGTDRFAAIHPPDDRARVAIGTVGPGEEVDDFGSSLTTPPADRARLAWTGGPSLDPDGDVALFRVHGSPAPGEPVDYSKTLAEIPVGEAGLVFDGWGLGGWGEGGWGAADGNYAWTSGRLRNGSWSFAVLAIDAAGNASPAAAGTVAIQTPPNPPARGPDGRRLVLDYDFALKTVTLTWLQPE